MTPRKRSRALAPAPAPAPAASGAAPTAPNAARTTRRVWYSAAMSLDGYIARPDGSFDWIPNEPAIDWGRFMARFDTVLLGRKTYQAAQQGAGSMPGLRPIVFSRTLRPADHPAVTVVADHAAARVNELRREPGKDIWLMGGGVLFRSLFEAGAVNVVEVGLVPVLLGKGIPLLPASSHSAKLRLTHTQQYPSGILMLVYDVLKGAA